MRWVCLVVFVVISASSEVLHAASFSIVSGDLHAQAMITGVPPTTDHPADVILGPALSESSVLAHAGEPFPLAVGSFSSAGGVTLNSAGLSMAGHATGTNGVVGQPSGGGSGSIDLVFTLDSPAQVHFAGNRSPALLPIFTGSASLSSNGSVVAPLAFNDLDALEFFQSLGAGSYEISADGSISGGIGAGGTGSETIAATIVPEPVLLAVFGEGVVLLTMRSFRVKKRNMS